MKFFAAALTTVVGLTALAAARPQDSITAAPVPTAAAGYDAAYSSTLSCIQGCGAGNVYCQAGCQGLPVPDEDATNATHDCIAACPPGGDDEKNAAWAVCQQKCINSLYYTASVPYSSYVPPTPVGVTPAAETTAAGPATEDSSEETGTAKGATTSGAKATGTDASKTTTTGAPTQSPNAGSSVMANVPMLGAIGAIIAAMAL